jgi:hypothetical protein
MTVGSPDYQHEDAFAFALQNHPFTRDLREEPAVKGDLGDKENTPTKSPQQTINEDFQNIKEPVINTEHTVVSGAVASKDKNEVYIDKSIPAWFHPYLATHELTEKHLMAGGMDYSQAHVLATVAEKQHVEADGHSWVSYTKRLDPLVSKDTAENNTSPPPNPHVNPEDAIGHHANKAKTLEKADLKIGTMSDASLDPIRPGQQYSGLYEIFHDAREKRIKELQNKEEERFQSELKKKQLEMSVEELRKKVIEDVNKNMMAPPIHRMDEYFKMWDEEKKRIDEEMQMSPKQLRERYPKK